MHELNDGHLKFITAGDAIFTLQGRENRFTFRVTVKDGDPNTSFVSLLTGPENTRDYKCIARLLGPDRALVPNRATSLQSLSWQAFAWTYERLKRGLAITPVRMYHAGRCGRCGRTLTTPESITAGYGPECITKI